MWWSSRSIKPGIRHHHGAASPGTVSAWAVSPSRPYQIPTRSFSSPAGWSASGTLHRIDVCGSTPESLPFLPWPGFQNHIQATETRCFSNNQLTSLVSTFTSVMDLNIIRSLLPQSSASASRRHAWLNLWCSGRLNHLSARFRLKNPLESTG